ncbi:response regulator transcription factor [Frankia sp. CN6]|uniref:Response regulator transcription factor n=1 Tax=Frankia nepalensis TaxID=1836974 RepID=A0A937RNI3_9ACTN|nr:LuxR C-terminal-related transcriptional regulator [Frankia nepalensis]MBL7632029.1 response regulator transcription factor [Frankia nepalensis]
MRKRRGPLADAFTGCVWMPRVPARAYDQMLQLAEVVFAAHQPEDVWRLVCQELQVSLFGADVAAVIEINIAARAGTVIEMLPDPAALTMPRGSAMPGDLVADHPFSHHVFTTGTHPTMRVTDLVSSREWRRTGAHAWMREMMGAANHLNIPLAEIPGRVSTGLSLLRADRDFSDQDLDVANRIAPLLAGMSRHLHHRARAAEELTITPREAVVLAALAEGLTAGATARRLAISERTVGKHLERLYRKLGVTDRLTAVLRAQRLGLLPPPAPGGGLVAADGRLLHPAGKDVPPAPGGQADDEARPAAGARAPAMAEGAAAPPGRGLACAECGDLVQVAATGRRRQYCSRVCQQSAYRRRRAPPPIVVATTREHGSDQRPWSRPLGVAG